MNMAKDSKAYKVLIVDDEIINLEILSELLGDEVDVIFATTGEYALRNAKSNKPDLVLLDISMPGMDGYQVCRALKSNPETEKVPVIFISARDAKHEEAFGLELGAVDYITKPFNPQIVKSKVKNHLANLPGPGVASPVASDKQSSTNRFALIGGLAGVVIVLGIVGAIFSGKFFGPPPEIGAVKRAEVSGYDWVLKTKCGPIPDVKWWKFRTHQNIVGNVTNMYKGDWKGYIEIWTVRLVRLQKIFQSGSSTVAPTGQALKGPVLKTYIGQMRERLSVIRCLAAEAAADKARKSAVGK